MPMPTFYGAWLAVPATALLDYLATGDSPDTFLDDFPSARRDQAIALLELTDDGKILPKALDRLATSPPGPEISAAKSSQA